MTEAEPIAGFGDLFGAGQIPGARRYQEDAFRIAKLQGDDESDVLLVLADGMGGHWGGEIASRMAVSTFSRIYEATAGTIGVRLRIALDAANMEVGRHAAENVQCRGMGCTLVACVVTGGEVAHWISVGDSPLWVLRAENAGDDGRFERLNEDHSMKPVLQELVRAGRMSEEEAARGPVHQLRSAITGDELVLVDEGKEVSLAVGDRLVMASDGLETLREADIRGICDRSPNAARAVNDLLSEVEVVGRPSQDNATVVIYQHAGASAIRNRFQRLTARTLWMDRQRSPTEETEANTDLPCPEVDGEASVAEDSIEEDPAASPRVTDESPGDDLKTES